jgi:predicted nucleic acid-binding protein
VIVVSNASPLILLSKLGHFDLLSRLFNEIVISQEVWDEERLYRGFSNSIPQPHWGFSNSIPQPRSGF